MVEKQELPSWLIDTYKDGVYRTVVANEDITVYRSFGYNAEAGGTFTTSSPALNRVQTKVDSAILPEWNKTRWRCRPIFVTTKLGFELDKKNKRSKTIRRRTMDENVIEIKKQVRKVIELLEQRIILEPGRPILKTLYDRYMKAEEIISSNEDISKIMISGGCRAYLDAFSDYMNPLLGEMDKAEKMLSNLKK